MGERETFVFQIGFNLCGTASICELFRVNGYEARAWAGGALAEDIFHAKATGRTPLQGWPKARFFGDLESVHRFDRPMLEAFREYRYLAVQFPQALFLLNERDPEDWLSARVCHNDGQYLRAHAQHLGLPPEEVLYHWMREQKKHVNGILAHFDKSDRLIRFDADTESLGDLADRLSKWFDFDQVPEGRAKLAMAGRQKVKTVVQRLVVPPSKRRPPGLDREFTEAVARHCAAQHPEAGAPLDTARHSALHAIWDGGDKVERCDGSLWPLVLEPGMQSDRFLAAPRVPKLDRLQGVLNEILSLNRARPMELDMQDGRGLGADGTPPPDAPVVVYNRRQNARNLVLWPLPGYHSIGERHFAQPSTPDPIPFEAKQDKLAWRGNLAGRALVHRFPQQQRRRPSHQILEDLMDAEPGGAKEAACEAELAQLTRYFFVKRHFDDDSFDIGFTLPNKFRALERNAVLSRYCRPHEPLSWLYGYRYIASLSGHDTGSNFFTAANSNAVVLKEEDGWELFYTSAFRPWEHYIPLEPGAGDVAEKLAWARANPERCTEIVGASQAICAKFASPKYRREILNLVLDTL